MKKFLKNKISVLFLAAVFAISGMSVASSFTAHAEEEEPYVPEVKIIDLPAGTSGWDLINAGGDIASGLKGEPEDIYFVNVNNASPIDAAWVLKFGYSEWGIEHAGNNVTYRPGPGIDRITLNVGDPENTSGYVGGSWGDPLFYFNSNATSPSTITFENFTFNVILNITSLTNAFTGDNTFIFKNCIINDNRVNEGTINIFSGNQGKLVLDNTVINKGEGITGTYRIAAGGNNQNYKRVVLSGDTQFDGEMYRAGVYDFRDVDLSFTETAGSVTIGKTGQAKLDGTDVDTKLFYTIDGSDPAVNGIEYTAPIAITAPNTVVKAVTFIEESGSGNSARQAMYSPITEYVASAVVTADDVSVDVATRTIAFNGANIEANLKNDFTGTEIENGDEIEPGQVIYFRVKGRTDLFTYTVAQPAAPTSEVTVLERTATTIVLDTEDEDLEFRFGADGEWSDEVMSWDELTLGTEYKIYYRTKGTEEVFESAAVELTISTKGKKATPTAADITINYAARTITFTGIQASKTSTSWTGANQIVSGATVAPGDKIYFRRASDDDNLESDVFELTLPAAPAAPTASAVTSTVTETSIKFDALAGAEFKLDDGSWVSTLEFSGLTAGTTYTFKVRIAATSSAFASEEITVTVKTAEEAKKGCGSSVNSISVELAIGFVLIGLAFVALTGFALKKKKD